MEGIVLPPSKSVAARALICREVFGECTRLEGLPECDDTRELAAALAVLAESRGKRCTCFLGSGAASMRFFLAYAASLPGTEVEVTCSGQLMRRPVAPLVEALREAGGEVCYLGEEGHPPLLVRGHALDGGVVRIDGAVSSQFASALMLASPLWKNGFVADFGGRQPVSAPYLDMTRRVMEVFAARPADFHVEADWSAASYFYEYALLHPGREVRVENLVVSEHPLQGDAACRPLFAAVGVDTCVLPRGGVVIRGDAGRVSALAESKGTVSFDLGAMPDLVPALAAGLCFAGIRFRFDGVGHLRHKECDRLEALRLELGKAGFVLPDAGESLLWAGERRECPCGIGFDSHGDHRIAMALAVAGDCVPGMRIDDAAVVSKSFPDFFEELAKLS